MCTLWICMSTNIQGNTWQAIVSGVCSLPFHSSSKTSQHQSCVIGPTHGLESSSSAFQYLMNVLFHRWKLSTIAFHLLQWRPLARTGTDSRPKCHSHRGASCLSSTEYTAMKQQLWFSLVASELERLQRWAVALLELLKSNLPKRTEGAKGWKSRLEQLWWSTRLLACTAPLWCTPLNRCDKARAGL